MSLENLRSQIVELLNKELKQLNNGSRQVVNDFVVPDPDALIDGYNSSYNPRNAASQHIFESLLERYPSKYKQKLNKYFHILFVIDVFQYLGLLDDASITSDFSFELPKYLQESEVQPTRSEPQSLADHKEKLSKIRRHDVHQQSFINDLPFFLASQCVKTKKECRTLAQQYKIPTNSVEFFDYQTSKLYDILWDLLYKKGLVDVDKKLGDIIHIEEALDKSGFKITFHEGFVNGQKTKNLAKELLLLSYLLPALEVHNPDVNKFRRGGTLSQSYKEHRQSEK